MKPSQKLVTKNRTPGLHSSWYGIQFIFKMNICQYWNFQTWLSLEIRGLRPFLWQWNLWAWKQLPENNSGGNATNWLLAKLSFFKLTSPAQAWSSNTFMLLLSSLKTSNLDNCENALGGMDTRLFWLKSRTSKGMLQFSTNPKSLTS